MRCLIQNHTNYYGVSSSVRLPDGFSFNALKYCSPFGSGSNKEELWSSWTVGSTEGLFVDVVVAVGRRDLTI
jgi:hypothetical protein